MVDAIMAATRSLFRTDPNARAVAGLSARRLMNLAADETQTGVRRLHAAEALAWRYTITFERCLELKVQLEDASRIADAAKALDAEVAAGRKEFETSLFGAFRLPALAIDQLPEVEKWQSLVQEMGVDGAADAVRNQPKLLGPLKGFAFLKYKTKSRLRAIDALDKAVMAGRAYSAAVAKRTAGQPGPAELAETQRLVSDYEDIQKRLREDFPDPARIDKLLKTTFTLARQQWHALVIEDPVTAWQEAKQNAANPSGRFIPDAAGSWGKETGRLAKLILSFDDLAEEAKTRGLHGEIAASLPQGTKIDPAGHTRRKPRGAGVPTPPSR
jgi:hypothetical protein